MTLTAALKKRLDETCREIIMIRAHAYQIDESRTWYGPCEHCFVENYLQWCHVFTRATKSVRWDLDNSFAWCKGCHRMLDQHWKRKELWVIGKIGQPRYDALVLRAHTSSHPDYRGIEVALRIERNRLVA